VASLQVSKFITAQLASGSRLQGEQNSMPVALGEVAHFSLAVPDPNASAGWWLSLFDLEEYSRSARRVVLGNDAIVISLLKGTPDPSVLTHMAFRTRDMAALRSARDFLRDNGVALEDPGDEIGPVVEGSASMGLWFRDRDGYRWELYVQGPAEE
jgi:catechol 2,3-dioxygenase-like lactoylglutathione lyase family enzyme